MTLPERLIELHDALEAARLPHAFGGEADRALIRLVGTDDERLARLHEAHRRGVRE